MAISQITANSIADGTVVASDIADGTITDAKIVAVANTKISGNIISSQITSVANTQITGVINTAQIADSAITTAKIAAGAVVTADIADANVTNDKIVSVANTKITGVLTGSQLANTAVTAGVYGGSSNSALITVDSQGRITSASNVAAAGGVTSLNGQSGAVVNTTQYAIGSYVIGRPNNGNNYDNQTIAGTSLYVTSPLGFYVNTVNENYSSPAQGFFSPISGTSGSQLVNTGSWRCVSRTFGANNAPSYDAWSAGLWVRYA